jgi:hypothetical protein
MSNVDILRSKLIYYKKPIIKKDFLQKVIDAQTPGYSIAEMCKRKLLEPLKKWVYYFNLESRAFVNPYVVGKLYCEWVQYCFGGMNVYNMYGFTTQLPNYMTLYTSVYLGEKDIKDQKYMFKKVRPSFFRGMKETTIAHEKIMIMTPERALIQMIIDGNSLEFLQEQPNNIDQKKLRKMANTYASKTVLHRVNILIWQRQIPPCESNTT